MNILLNLLIFSLPLGVVFRITPIQNVSFYLHDILAGLIFLFVLFQIIIRREKIKGKKLFIIIFLFLLVGFISLLINMRHLTFQTFLISFAYSLRYAAYASIIFAFQFLDKKFKESINIKLIVAGAIFTAVGFIQYFYYPNLRNLYYLGWDEHLYRLFSTFLDPNFAGAFLVLIILLLSDNIIRNYKHKNRVISYAVLWVAVLIAIFLTYSRSAFIMLTISIVVLLSIHKMYRVLLLLVVLFLSLFFIFSNRNIEGLNPLRITSVEARIDSANEAFTIFAKNPLIGVGLNAYRYAQVRYGFRTDSGTLVSNADAGTDNSYLFVLATTGVIGLLIFLDLWVNVFRLIIRSLHSNIHGRLAFASIAGLLVNAIFINSLFYTPIIAWIFLLIGLTVNKNR
ncbi:MAG: O-antigen ligase family protein [Candidatus Levybacteria bacterium]|nr:O-antigen ligase family protein [Candidatus Levybacteria bacterium]